jgi:hypothetical protein
LVVRSIRIPSRTSGTFVVFTPSSSNPNDPMPRLVRSAVTLKSFGAVLQLADVEQLHETRAGVVGLVADDPVEFGRVRHDLVNREHGVRRREDEIAASARPERLGRAHFHGVGRDLLGDVVEVALLGDLPACRAGHSVVVACARLIADARR